MRRCPGFAIGSAPSNGNPEACARRWRTVDPSGPAGSSRSTVPSSEATSAASATASLAPQSSICRSAFTGRDTREVDRRYISSGSSWETRYAYSRAVVAGGRVYVSGTAPIMPDDADPPAGPYGQARRCFDIIERALVEAGAGVRDVVRTRVFVTDPLFMSEVMTAHKDVFGDVRPAST